MKSWIHVSMRVLVDDTSEEEAREMSAMDVVDCIFDGTAEVMDSETRFDGDEHDE